MTEGGVNGETGAAAAKRAVREEMRSELGSATFPPRPMEARTVQTKPSNVVPVTQILVSHGNCYDNMIRNTNVQVQ